MEEDKHNENNSLFYDDIYNFLNLFKKEGRIITLILLSIFLSISPVGYHIVVFNIPETIIQNDINQSMYNLFEIELSDNQLGLIWSIIVSSQAFGALIGCFLVTYFVQTYGVKFTMFYINNIFLIISSFLMFISKYFLTFFLLFIGRICVGLYTGMACGITPMFIKEVSPKHIKGSLGCFLHISVCIGSAISGIVSLEFILGSYNTWSFLLILPMFLGIFQMCLGKKMPDTPNFLLQNCDYKNALLSIKYYYNINDESSEERISKYRELVTNLPTQISIKEAFNDYNTRKGIFLGMILNAAQIFCGSMTSVSYSTFMFNSVSFSKVLTPFLPSIGSLVSVLLTIPAIRLVEKYGRRQLIILTLIICGSSNYLMTLFSLISQSNVSPTWSTYAYSLTFFLMGIGYNIGIGPLAYFVPEELVHPCASSVALGFSICINWISTMLTNLIFYPLNIEIGGYSYLLFAIPTTIFTIILYFYLPELKKSQNCKNKQVLTCNILQDVYDNEINYGTFN
uniref:MFS domain-containing protein n=1 Tax=Strongyloides stercoralis TaxID=6248 RepID=A0A0K0DS09_STRER